MNITLQLAQCLPSAVNDVAVLQDAAHALAMLKHLQGRDHQVGENERLSPWENQLR